MSKLKDLTGKRFGSWTVLCKAEDRHDKYGHNVYMWHCRCICGKEKDIYESNLIRGKSKSCGCIPRKLIAERTLTHGMTNTRLYQIWENMKKRCNNPNDPRYHRYGMRGIKVCREWESDFQTFYMWAMSSGYSDSMTIDRIDNDDGYHPGNCRWANCITQCRNRSSNLRITINGVTKILSEWCEETGIDRDLVSARIKSGWDEEKAIFTPVIKPLHVIVTNKDGSEIEFSSVREASLYYHVSDSAIRAVCTNKHRTCKKLRMRYSIPNQT